MSPYMVKQIKVKIPRRAVGAGFMVTYYDAATENVSRLLFLFGSDSPNKRRIDLVNIAEAVTGVVNLF